MQKRIYLDSVTIIYLLENTAKKPAVLSVLRTPDALHLAYASTGRCEVILIPIARSEFMNCPPL